MIVLDGATDLIILAEAGSWVTRAGNPSHSPSSLSLTSEGVSWSPAPTEVRSCGCCGCETIVTDVARGEATRRRGDTAIAVFRTRPTKEKTYNPSKFRGKSEKHVCICHPGREKR